MRKFILAENSSRITNTRFVAHKEKLKKFKITDTQFPRSVGDGRVCLGPDGPLSSGTLWRRGCVRRSAHGAGITSFSGRSVKLRRQVEGQHPHNATAEHHRRSLPTISLDPPPPLPPACLLSLSFSSPSNVNPTRHARERYSRENSNNLPITRFCRRRRLCTNTPSQSGLIVLETINLPPGFAHFSRRTSGSFPKSGPFFTRVAIIKSNNIIIENIHKTAFIFCREYFLIYETHQRLDG